MFKTPKLSDTIDKAINQTQDVENALKRLQAARGKRVAVEAEAGVKKIVGSHATTPPPATPPPLMSGYSNEPVKHADGTESMLIGGDKRRKTRKIRKRFNRKRMTNKNRLFKKKSKKKTYLMKRNNTKNKKR